MRLTPFLLPTTISFMNINAFTTQSFLCKIKPKEITQTAVVVLGHTLFSKQGREFISVNRVIALRDDHYFHEF